MIDIINVLSVGIIAGLGFSFFAIIIGIAVNGIIKLIKSGF